jgi:outer membrane protein
MKKSVAIFLLLASAAAAAQDNVLTLSAGAAVAPRYAGSDKERASPLAGIDYQMANGLFASTLRGAGYGAALGPLQVSAAVGYRPERAETDRNGFAARGGNALRGMGDIKGSATALLAVTAPLSGRFALTASVEAPLSQRDNGRTGSTGLNAVVFQDRQDQVSLGLSGSAGDRKYMQAYFGVTPAQALRTHYARYTPASGLYQAEASVAWTHQVDERWSVTAAIADTSLLRAARSSPLTLRRTAPAGTLYVTYRY